MEEREIDSAAPAVPPRAAPTPRRDKPGIPPLNDPPSAPSSRRGSLTTTSGTDSRRGSVTKKANDIIKDLRKGMRSVTDTTVKAGHKVAGTSKQLRDDFESTKKKVKDKTTSVGIQIMDVSQWMASHTTKTVEAVLEQAKSGLSIGEKLTLFLFEKFSRWSKKGFTHVFIFLILTAYTALGSLLFKAIEGPSEDKTLKHIALSWQAFEEDRLKLLNALWFSSKVEGNFSLWSETTMKRLLSHETAVRELGNPNKPPDWTFWKSMFFCSTIVTTIGYGHIFPRTAGGQMFTIFYALIGIPLFLIMLADFGKMLTRVLKSIFRLFRRLYQSEACAKVRNCDLLQRFRRDVRLWLNSLLKRSPSLPSDSPSKDSAEVAEFKEDNFNLPISLALIILLVYMFLGCLIYTWESWSYGEAFYFIFISMTTIGFGDLVPEHPAFMMATTLYLVFGLALTAMCINIIQEKLTDTFSKASVKLKAALARVIAQKEKEEDNAVAIDMPSYVTTEK